MTYAIRTHQLTKGYRGRDVVSNVSMNVKRGEIYGFLGPNGAGKTTIMKMMTSLIKPTGGDIEVLGTRLQANSHEVLKRIGCIIEYPIFYDKLSARKNLEIYCEYMGYYKKDAISEALALVNLKNVEDIPVREFSLGMKQRLGIARAIVTKPELLILDEPVNGLDPIGMQELRDLFYKLSRQYGITLLISSHILGEIEQIADTIGIIREGKLIEETSMSEIRGNHTEHIELSVSDYPKAAYVLEHELQAINFQVKEEEGLINVYDPALSQNDIIQAMVRNGVEIGKINNKNLSLEGYFMQRMEGSKKHA
ncbi:ABC transporter ATP-binding protein [Terribacillus saccharophilus]|uniref:Bacitracin ABC transporter ATP-binding protein n=1 Tax=Terribacillus saccharophilus TaxID=361277 RepID=A0ABX4GUR3_9BACI|nr:ABC transporter ATP-binding protein [Terribacillus saccharophilus]PAD34285.1 bacitracin ABC transporter ATP-binding protein [Terribacillus saccharophilus]PAD94863.1 bacitracin ABC transporter ATP-binding protein [Terribacillus saccharophilus]PAD98612.1 bacitracin ABC transporter ATP-binding protein [Terribacillus saccharophilus]